MAKITVGIIGLGTVGSGVVKLLAGDPRFKVKWIGVRDLLKPRQVSFGRARITDKITEIVEDPEVEIVIEVAGGVPGIYEHITRAIEHGKHIVTANKELMAKHGLEVFGLANRHNVTVHFEAAVAGGIPLISTLQRGLRANEISRVAGILNGTTNYILTQMEQKGASFEAALKEAQALGFAEANPVDDVEGFDVTYKIAILASLAFGSFVDVGSVRRQGITQITDTDIALARDFGYRIKMIGFAESSQSGLAVRAQPMLVPLHHPLASVEGANNAIFIVGSAVGELMLVGPGAGQMPTASAVVGDVINLASALMLQDFATYFQPSMKAGVRPAPTVDHSESAYYIRLEVADTPGVIGHLGLAFGDHQVSLHSLMQRGLSGTGAATIVMLTHRARAEQVEGALAQIQAQQTTRQVSIALRVLG
jgi:homoserine dehydrogenase